MKAAALILFVFSIPIWVMMACQEPSAPKSAPTRYIGTTDEENRFLIKNYGWTLETIFDTKSGNCFVHYSRGITQAAKEVCE